ncbi:MAG: hypothetical protein RLZZ262_1788 [Bacteroidota bacterium]|jgi:hypothetical protein
MKRISTILIGCLSFLLGIQQAQASNYELDRPAHDFGMMPQYGDCSTTFTLTNTGSTPLVMVSVRTSCGCDVASITRDPIAPGESAEILYRYDSSRIGQWKKHITIEFSGESEFLMVCVCGYVYDRTREIPAEMKPTNYSCSCPGAKKAEPIIPISTPAIATEIAALLPTAPVSYPPLQDSTLVNEIMEIEMDSSVLVSNKVVHEQAGINRDIDWELSVFPNPLQSTANIRWNNDMENGILILYNMQGQVIREERNIRGRSVEWNDLDLSSGTYILTLYQNQQVFGTLRCIVH